MKGISIALIGNKTEHIRQHIISFCNSMEELPVREIRLLDQLTLQGSNVATSKINMDVLRHEINKYSDFVDLRVTDSIQEALSNADFVIYSGFSNEASDDVFQSIYTQYVEQNKIMTSDLSNMINDVFKESRTNLLKISSGMEELCPDAWLIITQKLSGLLMEMIHPNTSIKICGLPELPCQLLTYFAQEIGDDLFIDFVGTDLQGYVIAIKDGGGVNQIEYILRSKKYRPLVNEVVLKEFLLRESEYKYLTTDIIANLIQTKEEDATTVSNSLTDLVSALYNDRKSIQILNTVNNGALDCIHEADIITIVSLVSREGIIPFCLELCDYKDIIFNLKLQKSMEKNLLKILTD